MADVLILSRVKNIKKARTHISLLLVPQILFIPPKKYVNFDKIQASRGGVFFSPL